MYYPPASLVATGVIFALLCATLTALRFWVRVKFTRGTIGIDDWLILVAALVVCTLDALQVEDTIHGQASSLSDDLASAKVAYKINYAQRVVEKVAYGCIKLSFLTFYRRIFGFIPTFRKFNNAAIALILVWALVYMLCEIFICGIHPAIQWNDRPSTPEKCISMDFLVTFAATDVFTDIIVLSMPFPYIRHLHMGSKQKWAVTGVFLLGFLSTIAGILRLAFLSVLWNLGQFGWLPAPTLAHPPKILEVISPIFWTNVELTIGVVAANLTPLWPLIRSTPKAGQFIVRTYRRFLTSSAKDGDSAQSWIDGEKSDVMLVTTGSISERSIPHG